MSKLQGSYIYILTNIQIISNEKQAAKINSNEQQFVEYRAMNRKSNPSKYPKDLANFKENKVITSTIKPKIG